MQTGGGGEVACYFGWSCFGGSAFDPRDNKGLMSHTRNNVCVVEVEEVISALCGWVGIQPIRRRQKGGTNVSRTTTVPRESKRNASKTHVQLPKYKATATIECESQRARNRRDTRFGFGGMAKKEETSQCVASIARGRKASFNGTLHAAASYQATSHLVDVAVVDETDDCLELLHLHVDRVVVLAEEHLFIPEATVFDVVRRQDNAKDKDTTVITVAAAAAQTTAAKANKKRDDGYSTGGEGKQQRQQTRNTAVHIETIQALEKIQPKKK